MAGEIANFDSYALVAVGLFIAGLFAVIVYERSSSKTKREQQRTGTAADTEKESHRRAACNREIQKGRLFIPNHDTAQSTSSYYEEDQLPASRPDGLWEDRGCSAACFHDACPPTESEKDDKSHVHHSAARPQQ